MTTLEIIDEIKKLSADEIHELLDELAGKFTEFQKEDLLIQYSMLKAGLISEIKFPRVKNEKDLPAVPIKGKPLSETIIEDRR